ncbi:metal-dependent hydrolase [Actinomycetospora sp. NBRC 106375]|uniref:M48 family metallopeptidase n=1 Tax=Actinomycetospora sp. NBRC 106375 TaxID=3032207 RepID=UPI0024A1FE5F|nr:YgjP-like metallopeptidase domain-containing protein [Actinomycetospora sp. NBRC 106375]GLZ47617.1 metal-dependent hydrolase [Actinomycetospora sp. NBRC 106375]
MPESRPEVEVRRSARRKRTVDAHREGATVVVNIPASMSRAQERHWVEEMLRRLERADARRRPGRQAGDADLVERAGQLAAAHLDPIAPDGAWPRPASVRWTRPMRTRWASCTPADGTIRVSERLRDVPGWVLDHVLVHELVHLREPSHGPAFRAAEASYPRSERAIGYLEGLSAGAGLAIGGTDEGADDGTGDDETSG